MCCSFLVHDVVHVLAVAFFVACALPIFFVVAFDGVLNIDCTCICAPCCCSRSCLVLVRVLVVDVGIGSCHVFLLV